MTDTFIVVQEAGPQGPAGSGAAIALGIVDPADYGAVADGVTDDTLALQAALDAVIGGTPGDGDLSVRQAVSLLNLQASQTYLITAPLKAYSVVGLIVNGNGAKIAMSGTTQDYVLDLNGVAYGKIRDLTILGATASDAVDIAAIGLNWDVAVSMSSCYGFKLENVIIRNLKYVHGIDIGGSSANVQVSEITVSQCQVSGQDFDDATYWKTGIRCGSGTAGNILNHWLSNTSVMNHQYNVLVNSCNVTMNAMDFGRAEVDIRQVGDTVMTVNGVRSEESTRFFEEAGGAAYNSNVHFSNVLWEAGQLNADGRVVKFGYAGPKTLVNFVVPWTASVDPEIYVSNASGNSTQITISGMSARTNIESLFDVGSSPVSAVVTNYTETNTSDGTEDTIATQWIKQFNNTGDVPRVNGHNVVPHSADSESMVVGQVVPHRRDWNQASISMNVAGSGDVFLSMFTADKTETVTTVTTYTGATAASATPTVCRVGIYEVADNGDLTLVASSTNDTAMWASTNTAYAKALTTPYVKTAGVRYAVAAVCVTAGTLPSLHGKLAAATNVMNALNKELPVSSAVLTSQTNLPSSMSYGNGSYFGFQAALGFKLS